ncbi:sensor domain-containing protein [Mycobacterium sp. TNTM28]|uniref:Sensor domain-containing protein n=1 Tax=[Mycobacterium] fortunisiensis TaxID=2600579 RepID=A0ABS6KLQ5_9MYCO|nr:sensor domain-containing protein [[Mycobacterium] fortunisiensis]MBU9764506.1 sensor domain-containing protein [[Mycobacterium] fortunisiensis]
MPDNDGPIPPSLHKWIGVIGLVVAPTTLATGLCYYFGYTSTRKTLAYLGIDSDAVGFTTNDYVTKSTSVLFVTILVALLACTAVLGLCTYLRRVATAGRHAGALRALAWMLGALGLACLVRGMVGVVRPTLTPDEQLWLTPVTLGLGAALLILAAWVFRTVGPEADRPPVSALERALLTVAVVVMVLAAFWTTNIFATKVGEVAGINAAGDLWTKETTVILDTGDRLFLPDELVRTSLLTEASSPQGETYRYECFRGYAVRGGLWVLLPANWRPQFGYAVLVNADSSHRITLRTIKDAPDRVGNGANVREYWPCPELVPTATGAEVQGQLLAAADAGRVFGTDLTVATEYIQRSAADGARTQNCAGTVDSGTQLMSDTTGYRVRYVRELAGSPPVLVQESVIEFDTPHHASEFVDATRATWKRCAHSELTLRRDGADARHQIGEVTERTGLVTVEVRSGDRPIDGCRHAVGAKSNVVVDVRVCGRPTDQTADLVNRIRDRFAG